ncbi:MAG: hypothetical protein LBH59_06560 [Planctomycetaceae bacterium]|nr:hypothetical protein [Planctomycetaceae bacterium]
MWLSFFAAAVSDSGSTVFRWARVQENQDYFIPIVIALLLAIFFIRRYRIDAIDLRGWQRFLLLSLRVVVIVMLLLVYFHPQWERFIASSRVAIMIDSSASMGNRDLSPHRSNETKLLTSDNNDNNNDLVESGDLSIELSRLEAVVDWVKRSELVERLSEQHDVILYSFDKTVRRINQNQTTQSSSLELSETNENNTAQSSTSLPNSDSSTSADRVVGEFDLVRSQLEALDLIKADGEETNIGDALFDVLQLERGRPLAGVVIISDGRQNSGRAVESSLEVASRLRIPFYSVGVGASRQPLNFRVVSFDSPERFFPDDSFSIKVPIELIGGDVGDQNDQDNQGELKSYKVKVELWSQQVEGDSNSETKLDEKEIQFDRNGVIVAEFQAKFTTVGKRRLMVKILPPPEDSVLDDDVRYADIEIVDRKDRVLMYASAPSRDYQFICSQVFRDKTMSVDVYLPWAQKGIAQNADKILTTFPMTQSEMSEYDIVFAFDPDWVDLSAEQINVLEDWVARRGGGLVLFAGAVNLANPAGWISHSGLEKIWALYPVEFLVRQPSRAFEHHYRSGVKAWPLKFSRFGEEAEFLRPLDNQAEARNFWETFPGFYGFFPVKSVKPTATLLASTSAPDAIGEMGALFVEQYYGSGRVLYFGSSELWRLRRLGENFYEQIITRMIRHASQGRLQRDSDRGSVSLDKRHYGLGSVAKLRVTANDDQLNPITLSKLPIDVLSPAGKLRTLEVMLDPNAAGIYQGYVPLTEEGTWTVKLNIPSSQQEITRTFQVQMSDLERENPSRNEQLLSEIALRSGGIYFRLPTDAMPLVKESVLYGQKNPFVLPNTESNNPENQNDNTETNLAETKTPNQYLTELIKVRSQRAVLDATAEENMLRTFLIIICSLLLLEWTLRRLMKLA